MAVCYSEMSFSSGDSDVLMVDPFLDYINEILMDECMDDASAYLQQVDGASNYQAIFSSFQDIIDDSARRHEQDVFDPYQHLYRLNENGPDEYHVNENGGLIDGLYHTRGAPQGSSRPANSMLPSASEQLSSKLSELEFSFDDLKIDDVYTSLYVEELSSSTTVPGNHKHNGDKRKSMMAGKGRSLKKHTSEVPVFVDVKEVLISCAQAVAIGDVRRANEMLHQLHQEYGASANGTGLQRIAYIFGKALAARMRGMGVPELEAMSRDVPSPAAYLRASKLEFETSPYLKLVHYFGNQSILKAAEGASRLHIVDYGSMYGLAWPCLINALADRKGGPPLLVITGIEFPQPGIDMAQVLDESGRRLAAYAKTHNVPFQYHAIVTDKWEDLDAASLQCSESEVLAVNCFKRLRHVADEGADLDLTTSARQKLLTSMHGLHPHLLVTAVVNAAHNSPFFVARFRDALNFYSNMFDMLDTLWGDVPERSYVYQSVMNIVACEGADRVERPETYKKWHARITKAGFEQLPVPATILGRSKAHVKQHYHKDCLIDDDGKGWMLMGWKGRATLAMSAWKPCHVYPCSSRKVQAPPTTQLRSILSDKKEGKGG